MNFLAVRMRPVAFLACAAVVGLGAATLTTLTAAAAPKSEHHKAPKPAKASKPADASKPGKAEPAPAEKVDEAPAAPADHGTLRAFVAGSPEATLRDMLQCGLERNDEEAFGCYLKLQVNQNRDTEIAVNHVRQYSWKVFRKRAQTYVVPPLSADKPELALRVLRRDPEKCETATKRCKFFLWSKLRDMPAPVTLEWEEGAWRVYASSL